MNARRLRTGRCLVCVALVFLMMCGSNPCLAADFDRDGYADLAVGVIWEDIGGASNAGVVNVLYGSSSGIAAVGDQMWGQSDLIIPEGAEDDDQFGQVLAAGDFDGNGAADLAVGVPLEDVEPIVDGGVVHIVYGMWDSGLSEIGDQFWHQATAGIAGVMEDGDGFGSALAVGDFNGDRYDDLAIGVRDEDIGEDALSAGAVNVLYGSGSGLTSSGNQLWYEGYNGLGGGAETGDWFGDALAAGDFDGDGYDDLAVSIPGEDLGGVNNAGRVVLLYGTPDGLSAERSRALVQGLYDIEDAYETSDMFGQVLATGDMNGDGFADLAIGVPGEDDDQSVDVGAVNVLYGSAAGLITDGDQIFFGQESEPQDKFGRALAAGDFNRDGRDDLAVGIPYCDMAGLVNSGAVQVLYGGSTGLRYRGRADDFWHQNRSGMEDISQDLDLFGYSLAAGDFDGDRIIDLAVGVRGEDVGGLGQAGAVQIMYGSAGGISANGSQLFHQDTPGVKGGAQADDRFGHSLVAIPERKQALFLPAVFRR